MDDPDVWEVFIAAKNYGAVARSIPMTVAFGGSPVATHRFELPPGAEEDFTFPLQNARGRLVGSCALSSTGRLSPGQPRHSRTSAARCRCRSPSIQPNPISCGPSSPPFPAFKPVFSRSSSYQPDAHAWHRSSGSFRAAFTARRAKHLAGAARRQIAHSSAKHRAKGEAESVAGGSSAGSGFARARHRTRQRRNFPSRPGRHRRRPLRRRSR